MGMLSHSPDGSGVSNRPLEPVWAPDVAGGRLPSDTSLTKRIEYDLYYIQNWSLWLDVKIVAMTVFSGFVHENAH